MKESPSPNRPTVKGPGPEGSAANDASLIRVGLTVVVAMLLALTAPPGLSWAVLNGLLMICAATAVFLAAGMGDRVLAPQLTRWDEAALFVLVALIVGWFVDPEAVQKALDAAEHL